jgi:glutathione S-transferase
VGPTVLSRWVPHDRQSRSPDVRNTAENVALDMDRVTAAYEHLDTLLENRRYLVGDRFSRADLTLAALAAPTWRPPEHSTYWPPDELYPHEITAFRARFAKTRTREHVLRMYREHRLPKLDAAPQ